MWNSLSEHLELWRAERPSEYKMDEFIRDAKDLEEGMKTIKREIYKQDHSYLITVIDNIIESLTN